MSPNNAKAVFVREFYRHVPDGPASQSPLQPQEGPDVVAGQGRTAAEFVQFHDHADAGHFDAAPLNQPRRGARSVVCSSRVAVPYSRA